VGGLSGLHKPLYRCLHKLLSGVAKYFRLPSLYNFKIIITI